MAANKVATTDIEEILTELTCPLCKELFEEPKIMKNCPHTFCMSCLALVPPVPPRSCRIPCPKCGLSNQLGRNGARGLQTNVIVESLIHKLLAKQARMDRNPTVECCFHISPDTERILCKHCSRKFCESCASRHIDLVRSAIQDLTLKTNEKLGVVVKSKDEAIASVDAFVNNHLNNLNAELVTVAEGARASFEKAIDNHQKRAFEKIEEAAESESKRIRTFVEKLTDHGAPQVKLELNQQTNGFTEQNLFQRELACVSDCHFDLTQRNEMLRMIEDFLSNSSSPLMSNQAIKEAMNSFQGFVVNSIASLTNFDPLLPADETAEPPPSPAEDDPTGVANGDDDVNENDEREEGASDGKGHDDDGESDEADIASAPESEEQDSENEYKGEDEDLEDDQQEPATMESMEVLKDDADDSTENAADDDENNNDSSSLTFNSDNEEDNATLSTESLDEKASEAAPSG